MKRSLLALSLLLLTACSENNPAPQLGINTQTASIIGGEAAKKTDAVTSSTVALLSNIEGELRVNCTGTLISKNLVLTAHHCIGEQEIFVSFGNELPTSTSDANVRLMEVIVTHKDYKAIFDEMGRPVTAHNDVALIKLADPAPEGFQPAVIADEDTALVDGQELVLAGFGLLNELPPKVVAKELNVVSVPLAKTIDTILVTDQNNAKGACRGDSGGPAFVQTSKGLVLVGITRGAHLNSPDCRHYGEYTFASKFKKFILDTAQSEYAEAPQFVKLEK